MIDLGSIFCWNIYHSFWTLFYMFGIIHTLSHSAYLYGYGDSSTQPIEFFFFFFFFFFENKQSFWNDPL